MDEPNRKLNVIKEIKLPCLGPGELETYLLHIEDMSSLRGEIQKMKAELEGKLACLALMNVEHGKFLRHLSQKYQLALYEPRYDVDIISGQVSLKKGDETCPK